MRRVLYWLLGVRMHSTFVTARVVNHDWRSVS